MNKQELIDKLKKQLTTPSVIKGSDFDCGHNYGIELAIIFARQLEEPEKPVVPQFVADFYDSIKDDFENKVYELCLQYKHRGDELPQGVAWWFGDSRNKPIETLVMMHKFGYEVEKEKLYTVKFATEDFGKIYIGFFKDFKKLGITSLVSNDDELRTHFNEEELKRYKFWNNPAFEIKEVEE